MYGGANSDNLDWLMEGDPETHACQTEKFSNTQRDDTPDIDLFGEQCHDSHHDNTPQDNRVLNANYFNPYDCGDYDDDYDGDDERGKFQ